MAAIFLAIHEGTLLLASSIIFPEIGGVSEALLLILYNFCLKSALFLATSKPPYPPRKAPRAAPLAAPPALSLAEDPAFLPQYAPPRAPKTAPTLAPVLICLWAKVLSSSMISYKY